MFVFYERLKGLGIVTKWGGGLVQGRAESGIKQTRFQIIWHRKITFLQNSTGATRFIGVAARRAIVEIVGGDGRSAIPTRVAGDANGRVSGRLGKRFFERKSQLGMHVGFEARAMWFSLLRLILWTQVGHFQNLLQSLTSATVASKTHKSDVTRLPVIECEWSNGGQVGTKAAVLASTGHTQHDAQAHRGPRRVVGMALKTRLDEGENKKCSVVSENKGIWVVKVASFQWPQMSPFCNRPFALRTWFSESCCTAAFKSGLTSVLWRLTGCAMGDDRLMVETPTDDWNISGCQQRRLWWPPSVIPTFAFKIWLWRSQDPLF